MTDPFSTFGKFWTLVVSVWETGVFGRSIGELLVALAIFGGFFLARGLFARYLLSIFERWIAGAGNTLDNAFRRAVIDPLKFLFLILGVFFATQYLSFSGTTELIAENINRSLIAVAIFWTLRNSIEPLGNIIRGMNLLLTREIVDWMITGARVGVILIGAATVLQIWGIQVAPIIAGLGLFGVAVALGAQDLFRNLIGGISILIEKRFGIGDWINVDGIVEGTVEKIGFRSTLVRRFDQAPVFVPNQQLSDNAVTNFSAMTFRRISWTISLEYRTTHEQLRSIREKIEDHLIGNDDFVQPPVASLFVRIDAFNKSSIDLMIYCFTRTKVWGEWLEIKEQLAYRIKEVVEEAGAGFALPSRSVYVETVPPSREEAAARNDNAKSFVTARGASHD